MDLACRWSRRSEVLIHLCEVEYEGCKRLISIVGAAAEYIKRVAALDRSRCRARSRHGVRPARRINARRAQQNNIRNEQILRLGIKTPSVLRQNQASACGGMYRALTSRRSSSITPTSAQDATLAIAGYLGPDYSLERVELNSAYLDSLRLNSSHRHLVQAY